MGAFIDVLVAFFLLALVLLVIGALLTRPLWAPYFRRLRLEAQQRRVRAIEEQELREHRQVAEKEIEAALDPRERQEEETPPVQRIEPRG